MYSCVWTIHSFTEYLRLSLSAHLQLISRATNTLISSRLHCVCVFSREREDALNDILRLESCPYKFPSLPRFISLAELSPFNPRDQWPPSILVAPAPLELWSINTTILRQAAPPSAGSVMGRRPVLSLYTCAAGLRSVLSGLRKWANLFWQKDSLECFLLFALSVIRNCFFQTLCSYNIFFSKVILENMDSLCQI